MHLVLSCARLCSLHSIADSFILTTVLCGRYHCQLHFRDEVTETQSSGLVHGSVALVHEPRVQVLICGFCSFVFLSWSLEAEWREA